MVTVDIYPNNFKVSINGHANYGEYGKDIVCASVSCLFLTYCRTLERSKEMLKKKSLKYAVKSGNCHAECIPLEGYEGTLLRSLYTLSLGFEMLSEQYADYVSVNIH